MPNNTPNTAVPLTSSSPGVTQAASQRPAAQSLMEELDHDTARRNAENGDLAKQVENLRAIQHVDDAEFLKGSLKVLQAIIGIPFDIVAGEGGLLYELASDMKKRGSEGLFIPIAAVQTIRSGMDYVFEVGVNKAKQNQGQLIESMNLSEEAKATYKKALLDKAEEKSSSTESLNLPSPKVKENSRQEYADFRTANPESGGIGGGRSL